MPPHQLSDPMVGNVETTRGTVFSRRKPRPCHQPAGGSSWPGPSCLCSCLVSGVWIPASSWVFSHGVEPTQHGPPPSCGSPWPAVPTLSPVGMQQTSPGAGQGSCSILWAQEAHVGPRLPCQQLGGEAASLNGALRSCIPIPAAGPCPRETSPSSSPETLCLPWRVRAVTCQDRSPVF